MATLTAFGAHPTSAQLSSAAPTQPAPDQGCVGVSSVWPAANAVVPTNTQLEVKAVVDCAAKPGALTFTVDGHEISGITQTDVGMHVHLKGLAPGMHTLAVTTASGKSRSWPVYVANQQVVRHFGGSRAETAVAVANQLLATWGDTWREQPHAVVINGDREADAVAATTLATQVKAPILVVGNDGIPAATKAWIAQFPGITITAVGGEGVLPQAFLDEFADGGATVRRLGGDSRYATAAAVAEELVTTHGASRAVIADAGRWTDALPASVYAARIGAALLITDAQDASPVTAALLAAHPNMKDELVVAGSTISDAVTQSLCGESGCSRITETVEVPYKQAEVNPDKPTSGALSVALTGPLPGTPSNKQSTDSLVFASISNPVDAITAGPLAAQTAGLVLADTMGAGVMTRYIQTNRKLATKTIHVVGGPGAVSEASLATILGAGMTVARPSQMALPTAAVLNGQVSVTWDHTIDDGAIQVNDATGVEVPGTRSVADNTLTWVPDPNAPFTNPVMATVKVTNGSTIRYSAIVGDIAKPIKDKHGWDVAPGVGQVIGSSGRLYTWAAAVEPETGWSIGDWTAWTEKVLNDPRGWTHDGKVRLQRIDDPEQADIRIVLATPKTVDAECAKAGLNTGGKLSCWNNANAMVNADRMNNGVAHMPDLETYRTYVISHEFGHGLGHGHETAPCKDPNQLAPVMMQQSKDLRGCKANGWPFPEA